MRNVLAMLSAAVVVGLCVSYSPLVKGADSVTEQTVSGVLIDQMCGEGMMAKADPQAEAAAHTKSCATKDSCAASGYAVISGKKMLKFDANGDKLAKEFLAKTDKTTDLEVVVKGTETGDKLAVTSITAAPAK